MPRIRHSASARPRVRLISTPTPQPDQESTLSQIAGIPFSTQMGAVLTHAIEHGFRIEPDTRGKGKASGVIAYPPDRAQQPITISEVKARHNPSHTDNVRRDLEKAGMPPMTESAVKPPAAKTAAPKANTSGKPQKSTYDTGTDPSSTTADAGQALSVETVEPGLWRIGIDGRDVPALKAYNTLDAALHDEDNGPVLAIAVFSSLLDRAGFGSAEIDLITDHAFTSIRWIRRVDSNALGKLAESVNAELEAKYEKDISDSLAMVEQAEARTRAAEASLAKADAARDKARADCGDALRRARDAEAAEAAAKAEAAKLEGALAPLRALLGNG